MSLLEHEINKRRNVMDKESKASELNAGIAASIDPMQALRTE
jgi:hypothetical protein